MKLLLSVWVIALISLETKACDICGCGPGSYYIGILPEFKKRFVGFRYQQKGLISHRSANGNTSYLTSNETYRSVELWTAFNIGSKFRVMGFIPINFIEKINQGTRYSRRGMGDINLNGFYKLIDRSSTIHPDQRMVQSLWVGAGVKLPSGNYNPTEKDQPASVQNSFQLGTGSVDFSMNLMHDIRIMDWGLNTNLAYKVNTRNKYDYLYGNKFTANFIGYYKLRVKEKISIAPNAGILYERSAQDKNEKNKQVEESGGYSSMANFGVESGFRQLSVGLNYQTPLSQHLSGDRVLAKQRLLFHISYSF